MASPEGWISVLSSRPNGSPEARQISRELDEADEESTFVHRRTHCRGRTRTVGTWCARRDGCGRDGGRRCLGKMDDGTFLAWSGQRVSRVPDGVGARRSAVRRAGRKSERSTDVRLSAFVDAFVAGRLLPKTEVQSGHVCARRRVGGWCEGKAVEVDCLLRERSLPVPSHSEALISSEASVC